MNEYTQQLLDFLAVSPTPFHAVSNLSDRLVRAGFTQLHESDAWPTESAGDYFVIRNDSSLIAIRYRENPANRGFRMVGGHTDSPCLKVKPNAVTCNNGYAKLGLEVYGGALLNPWFDRDLGMAGRVTVHLESGDMTNLLIHFDEPIAFIPSLAIHLDRKVNEQRSINRQTHLPAVLCRVGPGEPDFHEIILNRLRDDHPDTGIARMLSFELSLYDCQPPAIVGLEKSFIASARLDNLLSCYAAIEALLHSDGSHNPVVVLNDHEEVGSVSSSGAAGPFLQSVLGRFCKGGDDMLRAMNRSMLVSADNAHGVHPNYPDVHDAAHMPLLNEGPVIKINHGQRYATNSETEALFRAVCERSKVKCQTIVVRSDMACGTTIGPVTAARLGVRAVDIGVPQLGMHSIRELAGVHDQPALATALTGFLDYPDWPF